jgi:phosphoesterase RecJ-like protein
LDPATATSLLTGIIAQTSSFQLPTTTAKTLSVAATLVGLGAKQQLIIQELFKTKDYNLLKLWGRALACIETDPTLSLLVSTLVPTDFTKTQTTGAYTTQVLKELVENVTNFQTISLLAESEEGTLHIGIAALPHVPLHRVAEEFKVAFVPRPLLGAYQYIQFEIFEASLEQALVRIKQSLRSGSAA